MSNEAGQEPVAAPSRLVVISGPSGAGKSTIVSRLLAECPLPLTVSVSATTRPPRANERHGVDYWFLTREEFERRRANGDFLEWAEVFGSGHWYGTLREQVTAGLNRNNWVILEIDVQGARQIAAQFPACVSVFVDAGTVEELERRLLGRSTESREVIERRLATAREELNQASWFQHRFSNRDLDETVRAICGLLQRLASKSQVK